MVFRNEQVSREETEKISAVARGVLSDVEGDFVELGCYEGDTSLLLAEILKDYNGGAGCGKPVENFEKKKLWIYDSFEGLPEKTEADESVLGEDFREGELFVSKRTVKERFLRAGLTVPKIKKAWFRDLTEADLPGKIAFAFLDGDLYESIRDSLRLVGSKMAAGGAILIHDYKNPALPGVAKAVDEWNRERKLKIEVFQSLAIVFVI